MKIQKLLTSLWLIIGISFSAPAQKWIEAVRSQHPTLQEVQTAFYDYWRGKTIEKGQGYKQFKRWEWLMSTRLMPDGKLPSSDITIRNYNDYLQTRSAGTNRLTATPNWIFSGPTTSPGQNNGLGRVNCIGFHPTDVNTFWVGTPAGGLWKTTNGGASWTTVTDNLPVLGVSDIAIDPTNPNTMYIATGDGDGAISLNDYPGDTKSIGILKSTDGGVTWNTTGLSWSVTQLRLIRRLIINPTNPQILVAATSNGIYRTTNGGANWTQAQTGYFMDVEFKPGDPNTVYAASNGSSTSNAQIYRSVNGGASWTSVISLPNVQRMNIAVTPSSPGLVDVLCCNFNGGLAGLWYSNNSGASFSQYFTSNNSNNLLHNSYNASGAGGQGDYDLAYALSPTNANEIWLGGINLWKSTNGGTNWNLATMWAPPHPSQNPTSVPVTHADKHFLAFHPLAPGTLFDCNDGGLYKTTNGGNTWTDLSNGLGISQLYRIGTSATIANNVIMGLQDNGTKELYNNSFFERTGGDGMECIIDYTNPNIEYASSQYGDIYKSTDGGDSFDSIVGSGGTGVNIKGPWITPYVMHPTNNSTLLVGKSQVYRSTNGGTNWSQLGILSGADGFIFSLAYAPSNPQIIYASTATQIYKTSNGGVSWTLLNGLASPTAPNTYIAVHPTNPNLLYVTIGGYTANDKVWTVSSTNAPTTNWQNISGSLPNVPVNCIVYQNGTNGGVYIGTDVGVFYRDASSTDWTEFNSGLPRVIVTELEISYNNNKLWAATFGRGLWSSNLCYINATAGGATTFCEGGSVTLSSTATSGNQWYRNGTLIAGATNPTYNASTAGNYAVLSTSWGACSTILSNTITVTTLARPAASITSSGPTTFCTGSNVVLQANSATGLTYQWSNNGTPISGATSSSYTANTSGTFTVVVTGSNNCTNTSNSIQVTANPAPATPTISWNGSQLTTSATGVSYQWYLNGAVIPGATSAAHTPTAIGTYRIMVSANGCSSTSNDYTLVVTNTNSSAALSRYQAQVFPNPAKNILTVQFSETPEITLTIQLLNSQGKVVKTISTKNKITTIPVEQLSSGLYLLSIQGEGYQQIKKIEVLD
jgi:photosystem II stability/assembly factor-like uncharacterized protein